MKHQFNIVKGKSNDFAIWLREKYGFTMVAYGNFNGNLYEFKLHPYITGAKDYLETVRKSLDDIIKDIEYCLNKR